jgi:NAD+ diphosphatase
MGRAELPIAARPSLIDRASEVRTDQAHLDELFAQASIIEVAHGKVRMADGALSFAADAPTGDRYFLGISLEDKSPYFAVHHSSMDAESLSADFLSLREVASTLSPLHLELALHAIALSNWHATHPMCSRCGATTRVDLGGAARVCDVDQVQHHPRTDGAVIVLVKDRADRILLGHQPVWPEGRMSTFAGFLEPGETFEQCVAREVREESGITLSEMRYLGSQPWPFPASVMIAFEAITDAPDEARADGEEITEVRWFTRAELTAAAEDGSLLLPPKISVARQMIEMWLGDGAQGGESWR